MGVAQPFRLVTGVLAGMVRLEQNSMAIFSCFCSWIVDAHATGTGWTGGCSMDSFVFVEEKMWETMGFTSRPRDFLQVSHQILGKVRLPSHAFA